MLDRELKKGSAELIILSIVEARSDGQRRSGFAWLGAQAAEIRRLFVRRGLILASIGVAVGNDAR
jgi:hypothetical protein